MAASCQYSDKGYVIRFNTGCYHVFVKSNCLVSISVLCISMYHLIPDITTFAIHFNQSTPHKDIINISIFLYLGMNLSPLE
ncbi:hypothetical protein CUMW_008320 [Citrus unshiu]|nr:hypothetical protein CUMW_008320 [Citrus unshiu]